MHGRHVTIHLNSSNFSRTKKKWLESREKNKRFSCPVSIFRNSALFLFLFSTTSRGRELGSISAASAYVKTADIHHAKWKSKKCCRLRDRVTNFSFFSCWNREETIISSCAWHFRAKVAAVWPFFFYFLLSQWSSCGPEISARKSSDAYPCFCFLQFSVCFWIFFFLPSLLFWNGQFF